MRFVMKIFWAVWNFWFTLPDKIRFLLVGGFNAAVSYLMYIGFVLWLGENRYWLSMTLAWIFSSFISFTTQKVFVFCTRGRFKDWVKEYVKCVGVWVVAYLINTVMLEVFVRAAGLNVYLAQFLAIVCTTVSSYILFKYFAFKQ